MIDLLLSLSVLCVSIVALLHGRATEKHLNRLMDEIDATDASLDSLWGEVEELKNKGTQCQD